MAVGCRCGTHRHKLFHPLVHFFHSKYRPFRWALADFSCPRIDMYQRLGWKI
jgi:hypothetical protein